ncbi:phage distal tail protein [Arthrobacter sp. R4]|uniref:phage distal tail protein n=1 Tax=Arthrobacter sp. R4 TaxID=644417 RepID=UPI003ED8A468
MLADAADALSLAVELGQFQMLVSEQGRVRNAMAQRQDEVIVTYLTDTKARFSIQVAAKDPRKFGDLVTVSTRLPFSEGGLTFPVTFPITFTGTSGTGVLRINNPGNTQAPVWLRIDGPIPAGGWTVTHVGKKQSLTFATSLALSAGEFVTVDMDRREVLAQGQAPRSGYVTSRGWFSLDPGDNDIAFSSANYSATANLTVTTKPSWS